MNFNDLARKRYSCRKLADKPVEQEKIDAIIEAGILAPTACNNQPVGLLICREHNRVLAKYHLEELRLPMGITDYELKKVLPTKAQLTKCVADAEWQVTKTIASRTGKRKAK